MVNGFFRTLLAATLLIALPMSSEARDFPAQSPANAASPLVDPQPPFIGPPALDPGEPRIAENLDPSLGPIPNMPVLGEEPPSSDADRAPANLSLKVAKELESQPDDDSLPADVLQSVAEYKAASKKRMNINLDHSEAPVEIVTINKTYEVNGQPSVLPAFQAAKADRRGSDRAQAPARKRPARQSYGTATVYNAR